MGWHQSKLRRPILPKTISLHSYRRHRWRLGCLALQGPGRGESQQMSDSLENSLRLRSLKFWTCRWWQLHFQFWCHDGWSLDCVCIRYRCKYLWAAGLVLARWGICPHMLPGRWLDCTTHTQALYKEHLRWHYIRNISYKLSMYLMTFGCFSCWWIDTSFYMVWRKSAELMSTCFKAYWSPVWMFSAQWTLPCWPRPNEYVILYLALGLLITLFIIIVWQTSCNCRLSIWKISIGRK